MYSYILHKNPFFAYDIQICKILLLLMYLIGRFLENENWGIYILLNKKLKQRERKGNYDNQQTNQPLNEGCGPRTY